MFIKLTRIWEEEYSIKSKLSLFNISLIEAIHSNEETSIISMASNDEYTVKESIQEIRDLISQAHK